MNNGHAKNYILFVFICGLFFTGCRINSRVVEVHKIDTLYIDKGKIVDSVFVFKKIRDTFTTDRLTIYRDSDHFRYYFRERNCTTYKSTTIIQPERIREKKETRGKWSLFKGLSFFDKLVLVLSFVAFILILFIYAFRR